MAAIRLSNSTVTSEAIPLQGASIALGWKNLTSVPTYPGTYPTTDAVSEVQYLGHENPIYTIRGYLLEDESDTITFDLLTQFAKSTADTYLFDDILAPESADGQQVVITSFDVNRRANHKDDNIYDYSIKLVATK